MSQGFSLLRNSMTFLKLRASEQGLIKVDGRLYYLAVITTADM
jgi:hypothetical protein